MKKVLMMCFVGAFVSCAAFSQKQGFEVKGRIEGMGGARLLLFANSNQEKMPKKITVDANGNFECRDTLKDDKPEVFILMDPSKKTLIKGGAKMGVDFMFIAQNGDHITISGTKDEFQFANVKGNRYNMQLMEFQMEMKEVEQQEGKIWNQVAALMMELNPAVNGPKIDSLENLIDPLTAKKNEITVKFIKKHPDYLVSAVVLKDLTYAKKPDEVESLYHLLAKNIQGSPQAQEVLEIIGRGKAEQTVVEGKPAADFTKLTEDGKTFRLSDYKGKYVLLDFWGSWCGPCRASHPHLIEVNEKYKNDGLVIVGIAEERTPNKTAWLKAIREDGLPWIQILNDEGKDKADIVKLYGINAFPTKILIDKEGKIIMRYVGTNMSGSTHAPEEETQAAAGLSKQATSTANSNAAPDGMAKSSTMSAPASGQPVSMSADPTVLTPPTPLDEKLKEVFKK